jgi:hypothetical protein
MKGYLNHSLHEVRARKEVKIRKISPARIGESFGGI